MFLASFALQAFSEHTGSWHGHDLAFGVLVASLMLLLAFCARNAINTGMAVVMIGIALNTTAIVVNHGMPVRVPVAWEASGGLTATVKHHAASGHDRFEPITDIIFVPATDEVISFGDLILAIGLLDVAYHASRRRQRSLIPHRAPRASRRLRAGPSRSGATLPRDYTIVGERAPNQSAATDSAGLSRRAEIEAMESIVAGTIYNLPRIVDHRRVDSLVVGHPGQSGRDTSTTLSRLRHPAGRELERVDH